MIELLYKIGFGNPVQGYYRYNNHVISIQYLYRDIDNHFLHYIGIPDVYVKYPYHLGIDGYDEIKSYKLEEEKEIIKYLNKYYKTELRKHKINKLLNEK